MPAETRSEAAPALRRWFDALTVVAFALALAAPLVRGLTTDETASVVAEAREPAPVPTLAWNRATLAAFPAAANAYVADRIGFRHALIRAHNAVELLGLGVSPTDTILPGKDGWLFFTGERSLDVARGLVPFTSAELARWRCMLERRRDWFAARGVPYVFVIAPDKHTVYPDELPAYLTRVGAHTRYEQLYTYMAEHSDVPLIDLRPALARARADQQIYYPHGTHWNAIGAHLTLRTLLATIRQWFPEVGTDAEHDAATFVRVDDVGDSWAPKLQLEGLLQQPVFERRDPPAQRWVPRPEKIRAWQTTEIPGSDRPRALVFHDSFGLTWIPELSQEFARVRYVRARDVDFAVAAGEKPDVVIHEMIERFLVYSPTDTREAYASQYTWTGRARDFTPAAPSTTNPEGCELVDHAPPPPTPDSQQP